MVTTPDSAPRDAEAGTADEDASAAGRVEGSDSAESAPSQGSGDPKAHAIVVVGPDGRPIGRIEAAGEEDPAGDPRSLVEQPAKVMRIGSMIKQLLDEVKESPLDEAARSRLRDIHARSVAELESGLAPELVEELERLSLPFGEDATPSEAELRIAQAQLVGWLEGLFHGIQTALFAQQVAARAAFDEVRKQAIGPGPGQQGPSGAVPEESEAGPQRHISGPYL